MENRPKVLTIIVTYNGSKWVEKCISSLEGSICSTSIFVVDNASSDNTLLLIEKFEDVILYKSCQNLGFGQANNIGLSYALKNNYDYVFLLNQDTWVEYNTLQKLIQILESNKGYGIVSPLHYFSDKKTLEYNFSVQLSPRFCKDIISDYVTKNKKELKSIYPLNFINAAAWLIPKNTLEIVGGFDPLFFHYGEDNNYCHRVSYHGLKIGIVPSAKIYHDCLDANNRQEQTIYEKLRKFELDSKTIFANINTDVDKQKIRKLAFKKIGLSLLSVFCLEISDARLYFLFAKTIFKSCDEIIKSRKRNLIPRSNYLRDDELNINYHISNK